MRVIKKEWDSEFFKINIGVLVLPFDYNKEISGDQFDLIYLNTLQDFQVKLINFSETYSENQLCLVKNKLKSSHINVPNISPVSILNDSEINVLYELAFESGKYSRFKLDKNFSEIDFRKLYKKWVDNSLNLEIADEVLVYKISDIIQGFITYKIYNDGAQIGLIGVSKTQQGKGIGKQLIAAVEKRLVSKNIKILKVKTQFQNIDACRFYNKLGFKIEHRIFIKHFWKI